MSKLPIGIQTFRQIREEGFYYVDKTVYARRLVDDDGKHYFLSRPRRFGKSLFVDTLKELFEGNAALFRGLAIHDGWNWSKRHPVVRLDFSGGNFKRSEDWAGVEALLRALMAGTPHDWHRRNDIARYEGYWVSVFYAWFQASMDAERSEPGAALAQLQARGYADKHRAASRSVHLIGVEISAESRDITAFETAPG